MKFYKIVNPKGHKGMIYKEGFNIDRLLLNPSGSCQAGGIYFSREDIFAFLDLGTELYEVEPIGEIYEEPGCIKKWKAHVVNLKYIGKVVDNIQFLVKQGANIHARGNFALRWAAEYGHLKIVKFLVKQGVDIHARDNEALRLAAENGYFEIVKFLIKHGAVIHNNDNYSLRWAAYNGHLNIVKFLVKNGADIHACDNYALHWASINGHLKVVKYLIKQGADIHACDYNKTLRLITQRRNLNVIKYLKSLI